MMKLLKALSLEQAQIDEQLSTEDRQVVFYHDFITQNKFGNIKEIIDIDKSTLLTAMIARGNPEIDIDKLSSTITANKALFLELDTDTLGELLRLLDNIEVEGCYETVINTITGKSKVRLTDIFKKETVLATALLKVIETLSISQDDFADFMKLYSKERVKLSVALATIMAIKGIETDLEFHNMMLDIAKEDLGIKIKNKNKSKMVSDRLRDDWKIGNILRPIKEAFNYGQSIDAADKAKKRNLSKTKTLYEKLEKDICTLLQGGEVRNAMSIINKIPSSDIRLKVLKLIYQHNLSIYKKMTEEHDTLTANTASHYQVLLAKYGISPETYEVGTIMNNSISDLEQMLQLLTKITVTLPGDLLKIVQTSNLETITNISSLTERGIISRNLFLNYRNVFNPTSKEYEDFMRNLAFLQEKKINPHYLSSSEPTFITPHKRLRQSIKVLEDYDLVNSMRTGMDCSFLAENNLAPAIDTLLELGYETNLEECLELLNYKDNFDRLKILKSLNIPLTSTEELLQVLTTGKFFIPDNKVAGYIYNAVDHNLPTKIVQLDEPKKKNPDISKLTSYENTSRTYSFDGVLISKNKVARNLSLIETTGRISDRLLYGVIKDSTLTDEELAKIVTTLTPKKNSAPTKQK